MEEWSLWTHQNSPSPHQYILLKIIKLSLEYEWECLFQSTTKNENGFSFRSNCIQASTLFMCPFHSVELVGLQFSRGYVFINRNVLSKIYWEHYRSVISKGTSCMKKQNDILEIVAVKIWMTGGDALSILTL